MTRFLNRYFYLLHTSIIIPNKTKNLIIDFILFGLNTLPRESSKLQHTCKLQEM